MQKLVVAGMKTGKRWSEEAYELLESLALAKARAAPALLRTSAAYAYVRRWTSLLAMAAQDALACTFVHGHAKQLELWDGGAPPLSVVLGERHLEEQNGWSRMPP